jgi:hypothetical protein
MRSSATGERFRVNACGDYTDFVSVVAWFATPQVQAPEAINANPPAKSQGPSV